MRIIVGILVYFAGVFGLFAQEFSIKYPERITNLFNEHTSKHFKGNYHSITILTYQLDTLAKLDSVQHLVSTTIVKLNANGKVYWMSEKTKVNDSHVVSVFFYDSLQRIAKEETYIKYMQDSIKAYDLIYSYKAKEWTIDVISYAMDELESIVRYQRHVILFDQKNRIHRTESMIVDPLSKEITNQFEPTILEYDEVNFRLILSESENEWSQHIIYFYGNEWSEPPTTELYNIGEIDFETNYEFSEAGRLTNILEFRTDENSRLSQSTMFAYEDNLSGDPIVIIKHSSFEPFKKITKYFYK